MAKPKVGSKAPKSVQKGLASARAKMRASIKPGNFASGMKATAKYKATAVKLTTMAKKKKIGGAAGGGGGGGGG